MKCIKILLAGGMVLMLAVSAYASNGNPRIPSSTPGAGSALVFCGAKPYQDDAATSGSLYLLTVTTNYFIDTTAYSSYTKYGVTSTPLTTSIGYLLLSDTGSNKYATAAFTLGSPVGPADEVISSIPWYNRGKPDAPSSLAASAGFETAKLTWVLNPNPTSKNYDYSSIEITIKKASDGSVIYEGGTTSPTVLGGTVKSYALGDLIDGRKLEPGTKYDASIVGKVIGKTDKSVIYTSDPAAISFSTLLTGAGAGTGSIEVTLNKKATGYGINAIAIPFDVKTVKSGTTTIANIKDLVSAINNKAGTNGKNVVQTLTYWDATNQAPVGVVVKYATSTLNNYDTATDTAFSGKTISGALGGSFYVSVNETVLKFPLAWSK